MTAPTWRMTVARNLRGLPPEQARDLLTAITDNPAGPTIFQPVVRALTGGYNSQAINFYVTRKLGVLAGYIRNGK